MPRKSPRSPRRRLVISLIVSVLLALVMTVGLAWGQPLYDALWRTGARTNVVATDQFMIEAPDGGLFEAYVIRDRLRHSWIMDPKDWSLGPGEVRMSYPPQGSTPWWVPWPKAGPGEGIAVDAYGFPFGALASTVERHNTADWTVNPPALATKMDVHGRWTVRVGPGDHQLAYLPTKVLWPAFLANVVLLGAACWFLLFGLARLRAWRWARARKCSACGYPRAQGSACPECGLAPAA